MFPGQAEVLDEGGDGKAVQVGSPGQQVREWQCSVFSWSLAEEKDQKR